MRPSWASTAAARCSAWPPTRLAGRATLHHGDLRDRLPFDDAAFDVVVASLVMHHLPDWQPTLCEFQRVLARGGRLVILRSHASSSSWPPSPGLTSEVIDVAMSPWSTPRGLRNDEEDGMKSYAIGLLKEVRMGPAIVEYLERIDATLAPYGGRFVIHGGEAEVLEGARPGDVIVIEFPDRSGAAEWYASAAYQEILPLRTENAVSTVVLVDGVEDDHRATDVLSARE